jgi:sugar O-acyltransferase (sialic acid O-acetyltransferase NeuD family)
LKLFIYCAGGFGKELFDTAKRINTSEKRWDEICFIDDDSSLGNVFYGTRLYSFEKVLEKFDASSFEVSIANGEPVINKTIYNRLKLNRINLATIIDQTAIISDTAIIGEGVVITALCSVSSSAKIGKNVVVNTKSIVGHDVILGEHCIISSFVNIGGASSIGENSYVGMGVQIKENTTIGKDVIVGMGSVVHNNIPDEMIALGNPARPMRRNVDKKIFNKSK